jgi:hypothetical protein
MKQPVLAFVAGLSRSRESGWSIGRRGDFIAEFIGVRVAGR